MEFLQFLVLGLGVGSLYALTGQGLVLIYRGSGVVNFAQGAIGMIGAFLYYETADVHDAPTALAWAIGVGASIALGVATHLIVMRRLRTASPLVRVVSTLGIFFLLIAIGSKVWGSGGRPVDSPLPATLRHPFSDEIAVPEFRLWLILIAVVVTAVLSVVYRRTAFGRATEAVAENPVSASALGLSPDQIASVNWALGSALAAVTAILIAPILFLSVAALGFVVLRGLAASLVGGFRSFWLTLLGAFAIGVLEAELGNYVPGTPGFARSAAFLLIIAVLTFSGRGLPLRGELLDRMPRLGSGVVNLSLLLPLVAAGVAVALSSDDWAVPLGTTAATAIVCLSLVLVTGYVGQLSLAQMALAGFAAWVAGRLTAVHALPFPLAFLAGVAAVVPVALVFAVPALRTRGINLAVITFGLAVVIFELILNNSGLTGGINGTPLGHPHLLWLNIDPVVEPGRYAAVAMGVLVVLSIAVANLRRGAAGRRMIAVRNNERGAAALGINVAAIKLFAFAVAGAIAAAGGVLLAFRQSVASFRAFDPFGSIQVVVLAVIGGIGYVTGAALGACLVAGGVATRISDTTGGGEWLQVIAGAALLLILLLNSNGLADVAHRVASRVGRARDRDTGVVTLDAIPVRSSEPIGDGSLLVRELVVRFGVVAAVDRVSFDLRAGEVLGVIGPNGAGKTTIIDAVTGFVRPQSGSIVVNGSHVERWSASRRASAGLGRAFQSLELFDDLSVLDNIAVACDDASLWSMVGDALRPSRRVLTSHAVDAVKMFGLEGELGLVPEEISYGHRRLVAIARAIAGGSSVLLLDEPAAGLGEEERRELTSVIRTLADERGLAVLLVEHDVDLVMSVSDRVLALHFGATIAEGTPAEILRNPAVRASYLGELTEAVA